MVALYVGGGLLLLVATFFLWALLHELSHFLWVLGLRPDADGDFKLYPHRAGGRFLWASVDWTYGGERMTPSELAWVSWAPRWPDLAGAAGAVLCAWLLDGWWSLASAAVLSGGMVDMAVGSIGYDPESDLRKAARGWAVSPWILRILGWSTVVAAGSLTVTGLLSG
jgi:hypothetical protein